MNRRLIDLIGAWRLSVFVFLLVLSGHAHGQSDFDYKRDFERILKQSLDSSNNYYYPHLLERFERNDSSLTHAELLALQIGFTGSPNYKPYKTVDAEREIKTLIANKDYSAAFNACNDLLATNPLNLTALMEKSFSNIKLEKDSAEFHREKVMKVIGSIIKSGSGTVESPSFVLGPIDGQTVITIVFGASIGTMGSGADPNGYFLDMLEVIKEGREPRTMCFNIDHATKKMFSEEDMKRFEKGEKKK